jgi:hypothetical protein
VLILSGARRRRRRNAGGSQLLAFDNFNRADSAVTLNTATSGHVWDHAGGGTWGVSGNLGYFASGGSTFNCFCVLTVPGSANGRIKCTNPTITAANNGISFRFVDGSNQWWLERESLGYQICKRVAGAITTMWNGGPAPASGDILEVVCNGDSIIPVINGVSYTPIVDAFNSSATKHGLWNRNATVDAWRYEDFTVSTL